MKIEAGKYYKLRDGEKAYVIGAAPPPLCDDEFSKWIGVPSQNLHSWDLQGSYWPGQNSSLDIIAEWDEPKEVKLPKKIPQELREYKAKVTSLDIIEATNPLEKTINQLIDYCAALESRVKQLEG